MGDGKLRGDLHPPIPDIGSRKEKRKYLGETITLLLLGCIALVFGAVHSDPIAMQLGAVAINGGFLMAIIDLLERKGK